MMPDVRKLLRSVQVHFPFLQDAKFGAMRLVLNRLKIPIEQDFKALSLFRNVAGETFLDVGANRGLSIDAILMHQPRARVQAFEPNKLLLQKLERLFARDDRVTLHEFGLGDEPTESLLFVPLYKEWIFDGLASFDRSQADGSLEDRIHFYDERLVQLRESRCRVETLDRLGLAPFFAKFDVQGYEYKALVGGEQTLRKHEPVLLIETPDANTQKLLDSLGYQPFSYEHGRFRSGRHGRLNTFFMTTSKAAMVREHIDGARA